MKKIILAIAMITVVAVATSTPTQSVEAVNNDPKEENTRVNWNSKVPSVNWNS